jgi:hypothetical protein
VGVQKLLRNRCNCTFLGRDPPMQKRFYEISIFLFAKTDETTLAACIKNGGNSPPLTHTTHTHPAHTPLHTQKSHFFGEFSQKFLIFLHTLHQPHTSQKCISKEEVRERRIFVNFVEIFVNCVFYLTRWMLHGEIAEMSWRKGALNQLQKWRRMGGRRLAAAQLLFSVCRKSS